MPSFLVVNVVGNPCSSTLPPRMSRLARWEARWSIRGSLFYTTMCLSMLRRMRFSVWNVSCPYIIFFLGYPWANTLISLTCQIMRWRPYAGWQNLIPMSFRCTYRIAVACWKVTVYVSPRVLSWGWRLRWWCNRVEVIRMSWYVSLTVCGFLYLR